MMAKRMVKDPFGVVLEHAPERKDVFKKAL